MQSIHYLQSIDASLCSSYIIIYQQNHRTELSAKAGFNLMDAGPSSHYSIESSDEVPPLTPASKKGEEV